MAEPRKSMSGCFSAKRLSRLTSHFGKVGPSADGEYAALLTLQQPFGADGDVETRIAAIGIMVLSLRIVTRMTIG